MPTKNEDLHGNVPDKAPMALLIIDMISDFEFPDAELLFEHALPMARRLAALKQRCTQHGIPTIYVNDNFGKWQSDLNKLVEHCLNDGVRGEPIVQQLQLDADDYFVLKPKSSGFFATTLETLLHYLGAQTLILTGVAGNICVVFTANDAYLRDIQIIVPQDCIASNTPELNRTAVEHVKNGLKGEVTPSDKLDLAALMQLPSAAARQS